MYEGYQKKSAQKTSKESKNATLGEVLSGAWQEESFKETSYGVFMSTGIGDKEASSRRNPARGGKQHLKEVNKEMCQRQKKIKRQEKIQRIFEKCRGIKNISGIKSARKRVLIPGVKHDEGETVSSRKVIANVFGEIFSKLYDSNETEGMLQNTLSHDTMAVDEEQSNGEDDSQQYP